MRSDDFFPGSLSEHLTLPTRVLIFRALCARSIEWSRGKPTSLNFDWDSNDARITAPPNFSGEGNSSSAILISARFYAGEEECSAFVDYTHTCIARTALPSVVWRDINRSVTVIQAFT